MKNFYFTTFFLILLAFSVLQVEASIKDPEKVIITIGKETSHLVGHNFKSNIRTLASSDFAEVLEIDESTIPWLSSMMHEEFKKCGGYFVHETLDEAMEFLNPKKHKSSAVVDYSVNQSNLIEKMFPHIDESYVRNTIIKLSSYRNRYYKSQTGIDSQKWLRDHWKSLTSSRSDVEVSLYEHRNWSQPSVIAKFKGAKSPDEIIVLGGHGDSIGGFWGGTRAHAPGADDNASGIATITEVIRTLVQSGYRPDKTVYFISYAAEEVGLRGSKEIAINFRNANANVVGALQLDMTNFNGSNNNIALISDNTNSAQNEFLGRVLDTYITEVTWSYDKCGYACSDHASWSSAGYPASFPFEAQKRDMNKNIHTSRDTITRSKGVADLATVFSKIALAYLVELDK